MTSSLGLLSIHFHLFIAELQPLNDIRILFLLNILRMNEWILTKVYICTDFDNIELGIVKHSFSSIHYRVMALVWFQNFISTQYLEGERGGSVVECRTPEREIGGSKPTAAVLRPWARHFTPRKYWLITQEALAPSQHDWKIVDWDVKPQHKQNQYLENKGMDFDQIWHMHWYWQHLATGWLSISFIISMLWPLNDIRISFPLNIFGMNKWILTKVCTSIDINYI